jgi:hypothetical protein
VNLSNTASVLPPETTGSIALKTNEKGKTVKLAKRIFWQVVGLTLLILLLSAVCSASAVWT